MRIKACEPVDVAELRRRIKSETHAVLRDSYRAVLLALDWVHLYRDGGLAALLSGKSAGRPTKLPRAREPELVKRLEAGPKESDGVCTLRGKDVVRILEQEFGVK
jgi:transposase